MLKQSSLNVFLTDFKKVNVLRANQITLSTDGTSSSSNLSHRKLCAFLSFFIIYLFILLLVFIINFC